jgi:glucose-6-phosphate-specific signal transduction histidine kinase
VATLRGLLGRQLVRVAVLCAAVVMYMAFLLVSQQETKSAYGTASFLFPVVIASLFWGWKGGALSSAGGVVLNVVLLLALRDKAGLLSVTIQGTIFYVVVGIGVGYLRDTVQRLRQAREEIRTLTGLLPICMYCKSIRDDTGHWHKLEHYLHERTGQSLTHGVCPDCKRAAMAKFRAQHSG